MSQPLQHSMILTRLTETGQALMQLNSCGYVDIETARHLVAAGLATPERIRVETPHLPSREFEGIGLTSEGSVAVKNLDWQMAPISGLSDIIFATVSREMLNIRAASRWLMPSAQAWRTLRYRSTL